jgi:hypothetical protein
VPVKERSTAPLRWELTWVTPEAAYREYSYIIALGEQAERQEEASQSDRASAVKERLSQSLLTEKESGNSKSLSIRLGHTTIKRLVQSLEENSDHVIKLSPVLDDRKIFIWITDISARELLMGIAQLNEWECKSLSNISYSLSRRRIVLPATTRDIPLSLQACMPNELIRFFGIGLTLDKLPSISNENVAKQVSATPTNNLGYLRTYTVASVSSRLHQMESQIVNALRPLAKSLSTKTPRVAYSSLHLSSQELIVKLLAIQALKSLNRMDASLFAGGLTPLQTDISSSEILLRPDGTLEVRASWKEGGFGRMTAFGAQLSNFDSPLKPIRPPQ